MNPVSVRDTSHARTREGLTAHELHMLTRMQDAISEEAFRRKPSFEEMAVWADDLETRERNALHAASCINGYVPVSGVRPLASARALGKFLAWCVEHRDDLEVLFRAKQHQFRRGA